MTGLGLLLGAAIGYFICSQMDNYKDLGNRRTGKSFADRLYGGGGGGKENFQYPAYLTPGTTYNLGVPTERKTRAFGNTVLGSPDVCCIKKSGGICYSDKCPKGCKPCDDTWDINKVVAQKQGIWEILQSIFFP